MREIGDRGTLRPAGGYYVNDESTATANMQPIIPLFQVLFKFIKRHLLTMVSK